MKCPKCNWENKDGASACANCYFDLRSSTPPVSVPQATPVATPSEPTSVQPQQTFTPTSYQPDTIGPSGYPGGPSGYVQNTSGQGNSAVVPAEIMGWNWGAFFLNWIWSIGNQVWIGLITLIPIIGPIIMSIVLGIKGNEWAWQHRMWESVDHFKRTQKVWAYVGLVVFIILTFFMIPIVAAILFPVFARAREAARAAHPY